MPHSILAPMTYTEREPWEQGFDSVFQRNIVPGLVMLGQLQRQPRLGVYARRMLAALLVCATAGTFLYGMVAAASGADWSELTRWGWALGFTALLLASMVAGASAGQPEREYHLARTRMLLEGMADFYLQGEGDADPAILAEDLWATRRWEAPHSGHWALSVSRPADGSRFGWVEAVEPAGPGEHDTSTLLFRGLVWSIPLDNAQGHWWMAHESPGHGWRHRASRGRLSVWCRPGTEVPDGRVLAALCEIQTRLSTDWALEAGQANGRLLITIAPPAEAMKAQPISIPASRVDDFRAVLAQFRWLGELAEELSTASPAVAEAS